MIRVIDKAMYLPLGDTATVKLFNSEFLGLTVQETDKLLFIVKNDTKTAEVLRRVLSPVDGVFVLTFDGTEFSGVGSFVWQVRQYVNGAVDEEGNLTGDEVNTPFGPQVFKVMEVLGNGAVHA